ncbi:hypothetical protein CEXT_326361 [Caerostris extrusa]|uniref:Uncharacterized protein n=1 Tax=Caerostris extrusa TaxID=172846 RepID=A0AAV4UI32_CAEEX|nr:hypothetical protein CEXT_326361 [Caerostris extrusa]
MFKGNWGIQIGNVPGSRASSNESSTPTPFDQMIPRKRMEKTRSDSRSYHSPGGAALRRSGSVIGRTVADADDSRDTRVESVHKNPLSSEFECCITIRMPGERCGR